MNGLKMVGPANWQQEMYAVAILFRIEECGDNIPLLAMGTDYAFVGPALDDMNSLGLITAANREYWTVTDKGKAVLGKMIAMQDQIRQFEIFKSVNMAAQITAEQADPGSPGQVLANVYDPRFQEAPGNEDLRVAMMTFLSETMPDQLGGQVIDPHRVIFVRKLGLGALQVKDFWFHLRLGTFFKAIEDIVKDAYKWQDIGADVATASDNMSGLYAAGMFERQKRDGSECSACGIPLGLAEQACAAQKTKLEACPMCEASFAPPPAAGLACPICDGSVMPRQRKCHGCGAHIDRSLAPGQIVEETIEETVVEDVYAPIWGGYASYGYVPYGYYNPYNPLIDALAFSILVAALW